MSQILIDGDILLYRFAFANEFTIEWDEDVVSEVTMNELALRDVDSFIERLWRKMKNCDGYLVCLSSSPNFRYQVLSSYKHNRRNVPKPKLLEDLRNHLLKEHPCKTKPRLEADDVMGILATLKPDKYIIATIDKDLDQIPGRHYNWNKDKKYVVSEQEADHFFFKQVLKGDPTDGYSGCPGIGEVRAEKILSEADDPWEAIVAAYERKGLTEDDAITQARLARILRKEDYDFKKGEPILWTPTK